MNPFASLCDEFYLSCYLNTELELPQSRDTLLHFFDQIGKAFPTMNNFYGRDPNEFVLEEDRGTGSYRWMTLEPRRLSGGFLNPPSLDDCHSQHELMLELAPPILSVSELDCEAVDDTEFFHVNHQYYRRRPEVIADVRQVLSGTRAHFIDGREVIEPGRRYRIKARPD